MSEQQINPLLERLRIPGETFRMPSQGIFYTNGELADGVKNGEVEVHPMTAVDEVILNTPDKLLSGKAIVEIFQHCIPQVLKPTELMAKDVDYLLVCLRMVSFGQQMEVTYQHTCDGALNHTYTVDLQKMIRGTKSIDPTTISEEYKTVLPNGQTATLKPLTYQKVVELYQTTALSKTDNITEDEAKTLIIDTIASVVTKVDTVTDPAFIHEWVTNLPIKWKRQLEGAAQNISQWGVDLTTTQVCQDCKQEMSIQVSPNPVSFFT
jgi:hypothetical protein